MDQLPAVGVHPTATDLSMPIADLAKETESRGFRSIYLPEHTHIPVRSEQLPDARRLPARYRRAIDPFIGCAWIASQTSLEVGTAVSLVAQHDAIALAKAIATLDHLADGRVVIGVGFGYGIEEAADHGVTDRPGVVEETVRLMKAVWTQDEATFEGRYRSLPAAWSWPKPARTGGPPVLVGAPASRRNFQRITAWADGWLPTGPGPADPGFATQLSDLRARWEAAGRDATPEVCYLFHPGTVDEMRGHIHVAGALGVQRLQVMIEDRSRDEVLPILDGLATALECQ